jgi:hypothetical protein
MLRDRALLTTTAAFQAATSAAALRTARLPRPL